MTQIDHILIRLTGLERWGEWRDDWEDHVDEIARLRYVAPTPPSWLLDRPHRELDWGARLFEVTLDDVRRLTADRPTYDDPAADKPFRVHAERQRRLLDTLSGDDRYGVVFLEMY